MSAEAMNNLTPGNIYKVSEESKDLINKIMQGNLSSVCFTRKENNYYLLKPATNRDKAFILKVFDKFNIEYSE